MKNGRRERIKELRDRANSSINIENDYFPKIKSKHLGLEETDSCFNHSCLSSDEK